MRTSLTLMTAMGVGCGPIRSDPASDPASGGSLQVEVSVQPAELLPPTGAALSAVVAAPGGEIAREVEIWPGQPTLVAVPAGAWAVQVNGYWTAHPVAEQDSGPATRAVRCVGAAPSLRVEAQATTVARIDATCAAVAAR